MQQLLPNMNLATGYVHLSLRPKIRLSTLRIKNEKKKQDETRIKVI